MSKEFFYGLLVGLCAVALPLTGANFYLVGLLWLVIIVVLGIAIWPESRGALTADLTTPAELRVEGVRRIASFVAPLVLAAAIYSPLKDLREREQNPTPVCPLLLRPWTEEQLARFKGSLSMGEGKHVQITVFSEDRKIREMGQRIRDVFKERRWDSGYSEGNGTSHFIRIVSTNSDDPRNHDLMDAITGAGSAWYYYWQKKAAGQADTIELQIGEPSPTTPAP